MPITAVVVNFNAGHALHRCVRSLLEGTVHVQVKVADNASTDGSAEALQSHYGGHPDLEILFNPTNLGFARAVNACARNAAAEWFLVINPDCRVAPDALARLRDALVADEQAALAGPRVLDGKGRVERASLRKLPDPWSALMTFTGLWRLGRKWPALAGVPVNPGPLPDQVVRAEAVSGACMLIRLAALRDVGYLDEDYGLHCEDLDLMYRLREQGWHCLYVPGAKAEHTQGVSSRSRPFWVHRQKHLGMAKFFRKFQAHRYPPPVSWLVYAGIWLRYLLMIPAVYFRR